MATNFKIRTNKTNRVITLWFDGQKFKTFELNSNEFLAMQDFTYNDWKSEFKNGTLYPVK
jgi:hypothetical protein